MCPSVKTREKQGSRVAFCVVKHVLSESLSSYTCVLHVKHTSSKESLTCVGPTFQKRKFFKVLAFTDLHPGWMVLHCPLPTDQNEQLLKIRKRENLLTTRFTTPQKRMKFSLMTTVSNSLT